MVELPPHHDIIHGYTPVDLSSAPWSDVTNCIGLNPLIIQTFPRSWLSSLSTDPFFNQWLMATTNVAAICAALTSLARSLTSRRCAGPIPRALTLRGACDFSLRFHQLLLQSFLFPRHESNAGSNILSSVPWYNLITSSKRKGILDFPL